jgi:hypothetical protein
MKEPFLLKVTKITVHLVEQHTRNFLSFSPESFEPQVKDENGLSDTYSAVVDLFAMSMNFVGEIAGTVLMGSSFMNNNGGI